HQRRVTWNEYKQHLDGVEQLRRENDVLRDNNARLDEPLRVFSEAMEPGPDQNERAQRVQFMAENDPPPYGYTHEDAGMARWREIPANVVRDRQQHTINALQNELQMDRLGRAYQSAAVMHDVNNPGYLENIYPRFQRRLFAEISHAQPWLSPAQVQQQALNEE